ncbi:hypothetical protein PS2_014091 [Malus domestica]
MGENPGQVREIEKEGRAACAAEADGQKEKACRGGRVSWGKSQPLSGAARADGFDGGCNGNADLRIC